VIIYLDEAGDLGFDFEKPGTSKKMVITLLISDDIYVSDGIRKAVRRTLKNKVNRRKGNKNPLQELKGTGTNQKVKVYFSRQLPASGWRIYCIVLNKKRVYDPLRTRQGKKKLYNFLARFLLDKVDLRNPGSAVNLIIDRSKTSEEIQDFNRYVANHLEGLLPLNIPLYITHERSHDNPGLQAVDLFCWGLYRKYERNNLEWYNVFKKAVAFEDEYLK
jgi:hypothetical protein